MGEARRRRLNDRARKDWLDDTPSVDGNPDLWINTAPRTAQDVRDGAPPTCLITWGELEWYAPAEDVVTTARDVMTSAAYGDFIADLLEARTPGPTIQRMLQELLPRALGGRRPAWGGMLGLGTTVGVMPGGSTRQKAGVVLIKRGSLAGSVTPDGARVMAQHWIETAVAARHDELVGMALADVLGLEDVGVGKIEAMLSYMASMRGLGGRDLKKFRRDEAERLRLMLGL